MDNQWIKESEGKLLYELDRRFIEGMAQCMQKNKHKYPPYNRQKPMDIQKLKDALTRHLVDVQCWIYADGGVNIWHLYSIACNAMMIAYQIINN